MLETIKESAFLKENSLAEKGNRFLVLLKKFKTFTHSPASFSKAMRNATIFFLSLLNQPYYGFSGTVIFSSITSCLASLIAAFASSER